MSTLESASSLSVDTDVGEEDVFRYVVHQLWHDRISRARLVFAFALAVATAVYVMAQIAPLLVALPVGALVGAVGPWLYRKYLRQTVRVQLRTIPTLWGPGRISISPEGIFDEGPGTLAVLNWGRFHRVEGTPEQILFYHGRDAAVIVPRRCFATPEAADEFLRKARAWHARAARSMAPPQPR